MISNQNVMLMEKEMDLKMVIENENLYLLNGA